MFPILARVGPLIVYTYTALIDLGLVLGLVGLYFQAPPGQGGRWLNAGLAAAVGGLLGARLFYAGANAGYFLVHLDEVLAVWRGGLSWPGAAVGALAGLWFYAANSNQPWLVWLDALAGPAALLGLASWSGCLAAGCVYGYEVPPGPLAAQLPDLYGLVAPRWPTQAAGLLYSLVLLSVVWRLRPRSWPAGAWGWAVLSLIALGALIFSFFRGDPTPYLAGWRLDAFGSAVITAAAGMAWAWRMARGRPPVAPTGAEV